MKKGIIVCVAGEAPEEWNRDDETDFRSELSEFDAVRITTPEIMPYQLHQIWLRFLSAGIMDIVLKMAIFNNSGKLVLFDQEFILSFVGMN